MVSASGSGRGRGQAQVPQEVRDVLGLWESHSTLKTDYDSMFAERRRLFERANDRACPATEKNDILGNQIPALEQEMNANLERRQEIVAELKEKIDAAVTAARGLSGSARTDTLAQLDAVKEGLAQIAREEEEARQGAESVSPERILGTTPTPAAQAPQQEMVRVGDEVYTREEYDRMQRSLQAGISGITDMSGGPTMGIGAPAAPTLEAETTRRPSKILSWWEKLEELAEENGRNLQRIQELDTKMEECQDNLLAAQQEGNNRRASYWTRKLDEAREDRQELLEKMEKNLAKQGQLMHDIASNFQGAMDSIHGDESRPAQRTRRELVEIVDNWDALRASSRRMLGELTGRLEQIGEEYSQRIDALRYYVYPEAPTAQQVLVVSTEVTRAAVAGIVPTQPPIQTQVVPARAPAAGGPVEVPEGETYFEYLNQRTGRRYRITIDGMDLSNRSMEEVYAQVYGYANTAANFKKVHVERLDARGEVDYTYRSRYHVRDEFFAKQLGWTPGAPTPAPVPAAVAVAPTLAAPTAAPVTAPPTAAPTAAAPTVAAPVTAAPTAAAPTSVEEAQRRMLDTLAGANAILLATRFRLTDTAQSSFLQRFLSGEAPVLSVRVTTPEAAGELLRYVSIAAALRGVPADFGIAEPAEGRNYYSVYYRRVSSTEQTRRDAIANENPMGLINLDSTMPVDTAPYNGFVSDFNSRHPEMAIDFEGFAQNSDQLAADPESQSIAYGAETASTLAGWRFNLGTRRTNGAEFMADTMYGRRGEHPYEIETTDAGPRLSLEETAMFAAGFFTANTGRAMVSMQGVENVEGIDVNIFAANINAARDHTSTTAYMEHGEAARRGISSVEYGKYAGSAYYRMQRILDPEHPELYQEMLATLPPDQRAGLEAGAELLGRFMYEMRRSRLGEPDDPAATLAACVESARMIIVAKGYAETGDLAFTFFTHGEREYMVGTNTLVTHDFERWKPAGGWQFEDPDFQRANRNQGFYNMLFVPTDTPGSVLIVGVIGDNDELQMLSQPVEYQLDWRDSVGLAGFTRRWCHNLPLINVGKFPSVYYEESFEAPYIGLPTEYEDVSPPGLLEARTRLGYAVPQLGGEAEHYTTGEVLDETEFTISNPTLYYQDRTVAGPVSLDQMLENPYTEVEWAMFRVPRRGENVFYATLGAQAAERYADNIQGDLVHTAEFRDGVVYMYVDTTTGKVVDALDPDLRDAEGHRVDRFAVGTYTFTFEGDVLRSQVINIQPGAEAQGAGIPADARNIVLTRVSGRELLEMRENQAGVVTASGEGTITIGFNPAGNVRSAISSDPELYPPDESYLALAAVRAPMPVRAGTTVAAGAFDYTAFEASVRRLAEIRTEYMGIAADAKTFESGEEEKTTMIRMANLLIERRRIYDGMLEGVEAALPSYTGDARAELERFRDSIVETRGWSEEDLTAFISSLNTDTFYSRAYVQARADELVTTQAEFMRVRDQYYASQDATERGELVDQGWTLILRRREIYEDILRRIDSAVVMEPADLRRLTDFRAQVATAMEAYYPSTEVDYDSLRADYGR